MFLSCPGLIKWRIDSLELNTRHGLGPKLQASVVNPAIYCCKPIVTMEHRFNLADVWFYIAGSTCGRCKEIHVYWCKCEKKCIRMGITKRSVII